MDASFIFFPYTFSQLQKRIGVHKMCNPHQELTMDSPNYVTESTQRWVLCFLQSCVLVKKKNTSTMAHKEEREETTATKHWWSCDVVAMNATAEQHLLVSGAVQPCAPSNLAIRRCAVWTLWLGLFVMVLNRCLETCKADFSFVQF